MLFGLELVLECCTFDFGTLGTSIFFIEALFGSDLTFIYWLMQDGTNCGISCSVSAVLLKLYLRLLHLVFVLLKWEGMEKNQTANINGSMIEIKNENIWHHDCGRF